MPLCSSQMRSWLAGLVCAALGVGLLQCSVTPLGATDAGIAKARTASPPGADAFERECSSCHGKRGEGLTIAPAVMGVGALAEYPRNDASSSDPAYSTNAPVQGDSSHVPGQSKRGPFHTAQDVYDYVSSRMPLPKSVAGTLKPEEYWAIVNYMLVANGVAVPAAGVSEANAKSVPVR
jgi:mono/diheme cytochrome c family protein